MQTKKILFIENRQKTFFWEKLAIKLAKKDYKISWVVQNHSFLPDAGNLHIIPYPSKKEKILSDNKLFQYISSTDRIINYFQGNSLHYQYYYDKIYDIITSTKPNFIVGESTLFHEIIASAIAKKLQIPYFSPCNVAYPKGRFSFFKFDSNLTEGKDKISLNNSQIDSIISSIKDKRSLPSYVKQDLSKSDHIESLSYKASILKPYVLGEKYNTPSPFKKYLRNKETRETLSLWNQLSKEKNWTFENKKILLFPLQFQPEANLDVHGNKFRDQTKTVSKISKLLPNNWILCVKPNPKSKYELNKALLNVVSKSNNIFPINSNLTMENIFPTVDAVFTVTGTIAQECFFSDKPFAVFGPCITENAINTYKLSSYEDIIGLVRLIDNRKYKLPSNEEKRNLLKKLFKQSFVGSIGDPIYNPESLEDKNINLVCDALLGIIER